MLPFISEQVYENKSNLKNLKIAKQESFQILHKVPEIKQIGKYKKQKNNNVV
jgi:hypothetical protein